MANKRTRSSKPSSTSKQLTLPLSGKKRTARKKRPRQTGDPPKKLASASKAAQTATTGQVEHSVAERLARAQRDISVAEFFAKNRHLLGFDNRRKALLTSVKEAVDNSLDACEEADILPDIDVRIDQLDEKRFRIRVADNGPGIVKNQIPNIFGKLLYGSKFHRLKMSRGQQGIGISAAGMYGLLTTGRPIGIYSRTGSRSQGHHYRVAIDTKKNRPDVILDEPAEVDFPHGTVVRIDLEGSYAKGRQSVDEYLEQTAIANPHARMTYHTPTGEQAVYERASEQLPPQTREIKPHPHGIELGMLLRMFKETHANQLGGFLRKEFSRLGGSTASRIAAKANLTPKSWIKTITHQQAETLYRAMQEARVKAPPTDCLAPIETKQILAGLLKEVKAEFFTAVTRSPSVYRGNPFQIEAGLAYGGQLPGDELARVIRFANRVPLLYQQSHCSIYRSVVDVNWRPYGLGQSRGALPTGPLVVMVHIASVWVPFTSESKEAIADYDEIRREVKLAVRECARKLSIYLRRRARQHREGQRRSVFQRYIGEVVEAVNAITPTDRERLRRDLLATARQITARADVQLDENGNPIKKPEQQEKPVGEDTIIVHREAPEPSDQDLFGNGNNHRPRPRRNNGRRARRRAS